MPPRAEPVANPAASPELVHVKPSVTCLGGTSALAMVKRPMSAGATQKPASAATTVSEVVGYEGHAEHDQH